jgi:pyrimidine operon attenuation protein/uracil phosphoribosyltransferase
MRQLLSAGQVLDRGDLQQILRTMADAILALTWPSGESEHKPWLIGVHRGGAQVAKELSDVIALSEGWRPPLGTIDITLYRDDAWLKGPQALPIRTVGAATDLPGDPTGRRIVLVDDVLHTGRTIRAALNELVDYGRPEAVRLAVLVDRGGRELPIAADVVGQTLAVARGQSLELQYGPDGRMSGARVEGPLNP